jgi:hypothetical protein
MLNNFKQQMHGSEDILKSAPWPVRKAFRSVAIPVELRAREVLFHAEDTGDALPAGGNGRPRFACDGLSDCSPSPVRCAAGNWRW